MRKILLPLAMAGTLALGGCAAYGGNGGLLGGILGNDRYDDDRYGYDGGDVRCSDRDQFNCVFRSDGRIVDFRLG